MKLRTRKYPTQNELKKLFHYENGNLIRKTRPTTSVNIGDKAGWRDRKGYLRVTINNASYGVNRIIWILCRGSFDPSLEVDHINGIRDDNRIENLRLVTHHHNQFNKLKSKGYCWRPDNKKWHAMIKKNYRNIHLGYYNTEEEAHIAYLNAKNKYHQVTDQSAL